MQRKPEFNHLPETPRAIDFAAGTHDCPQHRITSVVKPWVVKRIHQGELPVGFVAGQSLCDVRGLALYGACLVDGQTADDPAEVAPTRTRTIPA